MTAEHCRGDSSQKRSMQLWILPIICSELKDRANNYLEGKFGSLPCMFYKPEIVLMVFWQLNHQDHPVAWVNDMVRVDFR